MIQAKLRRNQVTPATTCNDSFKLIDTLASEGVTSSSEGARRSVSKRWLIVKSKSEGARAAPNLSSQLIVASINSEISFHFCDDCRIFREGVKDDEGVFVKQQSANIPDAVKKWRRSSNSNNDATCVIFNKDVSH